jgi:hypothetical protein
VRRPEAIVSPELVRTLITALAGAAELLRTDPEYCGGATCRTVLAALKAADEGGAWFGGLDAAARIAALREAVEELLVMAGAGLVPLGPTVSRARGALAFAGGGGS